MKTDTIYYQLFKRFSDYPPSITLYAVEAKEVNPPVGQAPIHWRLMTTHIVVAIEQALQVIQWYCWRCGLSLWQTSWYAHFGAWSETV